MADVPAPPADDGWADLRPLLDRELMRLPEKYRAPLVLCHLEGKSKPEAAWHLGLPEGTVSSRMARGREILRRRLAGRCPAVTAGGLAAALSARAAVPARLLDPTVQAAVLSAVGRAPAGMVSAQVVALKQEVLQAMFLTKFKAVIAAALVAGLVGTGAAVFAPRASADGPADKPAPTKPVPPKAEKPAPGATKPAPDGEKKPTLAGIVRAVDVAKGTITIAFRKADQEIDRTFEAGKDTEVFVDGRAGKLADLKPGAHAKVRLTADHKTVVDVRVEGPVVRGDVKAVDADKGTLVLAVAAAAGREEKAFELAKDVKVSVAGHKKATLADVKAGTGASLTLSADQSKVVAVYVGPEKKAGDGTKGGQGPDKKKGDK